MRSWHHLTLPHGVELHAEDGGISLVVNGTTFWLSNEQLGAMVEAIGEHLSGVRGGEVDVSSAAFKARYYGT